MFSLKDFLTAMVLAFLCLLVRITPACAAQVEVFIPTEDYAVEIVTVEAETDNSNHAPQQTNYEEIQIIPDKMQITLTQEENTTVETFYPVEEADYGQYVSEAPVDDDILFMIPLITKNSLPADNSDKEVVMALALSATNFPSDDGYDTIAQFGLMYFF